MVEEQLRARDIVDGRVLDAMERVPRELFVTAGDSGVLGMDVLEEYGGGGVRDFRFNAVVSEEIMRAGVAAAGAGIG